MLWLYLHFPSLQLDSLGHQQEQTSPVVLLDSRNNRVVQRNATATEAGIQLDMGLGTAAALCHNLQVLPYQPDQEAAQLQHIAERLYSMTSDISLCPPQGLALRIHNMLSLYGGLQPYWQTLNLALQPLKLNYNFATGVSPLMARLLAYAGWNNVSEERKTMLAHTGKQPLGLTELATKTQQKLQRVGIESVGKLLKLPLKDVAKRFDIDLVTYLGRLTGEFHHALTFYHPPERFERYLELMYEIENTQTLLHPLKHLYSALELFLKLRDQLTQSLHLTLHLRDKGTQEVQIHSAQGEYQAQRWMSLTELTLEQITLDAPVYAMTLCTGGTQVRTPERADLFDGNKGTLNRLQLVSMLQAKLGEQAIKGIRLENDHRPENASGQASFEHSSPQTFQLHALRPSLLLPKPQPLREKVTLISGPERLHTGWWDQHPVTRDYFIARSDQGQWYWVFRTPQTHWFVHGIFS